MKDVLCMEAECRAPPALEDIWGPEEGFEGGWGVWEEEVREVREDWIERRWWAKQALGYVLLLLFLCRNTDKWCVERYIKLEV